MSSTIAQHKEIDSRFCGNSKKEDKNDKREVIAGIVKKKTRMTREKLEVTVWGK